MADLPPVRVLDESIGRYSVPFRVRNKKEPQSDEWCVTSKYEIVNWLGSGAYGEVAPPPPPLLPLPLLCSNPEPSAGCARSSRVRPDEDRGHQAHKIRTRFREMLSERNRYYAQAEPSQHRENS
jgi:hypothetical protein